MHDGARLLTRAKINCNGTSVDACAIYGVLAGLINASVLISVISPRYKNRFSLITIK